MWGCQGVIDAHKREFYRSIFRALGFAPSNRLHEPGAITTRLREGRAFAAGHAMEAEGT
jgi:hypothetical protein